MTEFTLKVVKFFSAFKFSVQHTNSHNTLRSNPLINPLFCMAHGGSFSLIELSQKLMLDLVGPEEENLKDWYS